MEHLKKIKSKLVNCVYEELEHISMTVEALQLWCEKMKLTSKDR